MYNLQHQLAALAQERSGYVARLEKICIGPHRQEEVSAYLRLIERVSDAAIRLAVVSRDHRSCVQMFATCNFGEKSSPIEIYDLSRGGLAMRGALAVYEGDEVDIEFSSGRRIMAEVRWWIDGCCGVQFCDELELTDPLMSSRKPQ